MIRISTKTRYALRALLEMACTKDKKVFLLKDLSRHQNISRKYLEQIFHVLRRHKIVCSRVGKRGGFYLPPDLSTITILRILEALEGRLDIVNCQKTWRNCERIFFCPSRAIWQELNTTLKKLLASKNLGALSQEKDIQKKCSFVVARTARRKKK